MSRIVINRPKPFIFHTAEPEPGNRQHFPPLIGFEPRFANRFIFIFPTYFNIPSWLVQSVTRPSMELTAGRYTMTWHDIVVEMLDIVDYPIIETLITQINNGNNHQFFVETYNLIDELTEKWEINGTIRSVDFGELNYRNDTVAQIQLTILPEYCIYNPI